MTLASISQTGISQSTIRGPRGRFVPQARTVEFFDDFLTLNMVATTTAVVSTWDLTLGTSAGVACGDGAGGSVVITPDGTVDRETILQMNSEWIPTMATDKRVMFETRLAHGVAASAEIFVGLCVKGTALGNLIATPQGVDHAGFWTEGAAGTGSILCGYGIDDDVQVDTGVDLADDEFVTLGFEYGPHVGTNVWKFYVNGNLVTTQTDTRIPAEEMTVLVGVRNGTAASHDLTIDYVYALADL
jgi:hypothetical protein